jgi:hypothetical protein
MHRKPGICGGNRWNCEFIANGKPSNVQNLRMWSARTPNGPCTSRRPAGGHRPITAPTLPYDQRAAMTHHALPRKAKIMLKCTSQKGSQNGPKTTFEGQKVPQNKQIMKPAKAKKGSKMDLKNGTKKRTEKSTKESAKNPPKTANNCPKLAPN